MNTPPKGKVHNQIVNYLRGVMAADAQVTRSKVIKDTGCSESYFHEVMRTQDGQDVSAGLKPEDRVSLSGTTGHVEALVADVDALEAADAALLAAFEDQEDGDEDLEGGGAKKKWWEEDTSPAEANWMVDNLETSALHELNEIPDLGARAGCYAIYYVGEADHLYGPLKDSGTPIYVGKADASGTRTGNTDDSRSNPVKARLGSHANSLNHTDLGAGLFLARVLKVAPGKVKDVETMLIAHYKPLWNSVMGGFGLADPGAGRAKSARSDWDVLHEGRPYANQDQPGRRTRDEVESQVLAYLNPEEQFDLAA